MTEKTTDFRHLFDAVFGKPEIPALVIIKEPILDLRAFMVQVMRQYSGLVDNDGMRWQKAFLRKEDGQQFRVTVTLERIEHEILREAHKDG
jgi:hypothetical protein